MFFSKIFGIAVLIALAVAHPPASSYSSIKQNHGKHSGSSVHHGWNGGHVDLHSHHHDSHPEYKYSYGVRDPHTGDKKDAWESRNGDKVRGGYSLSESDRKRTVKYSSDKKHGLLVDVKASERHNVHKW